jgi:hypothetical protein
MTAVSNCPIFSGSIELNIAAYGDINLSGIQEIAGDLNVENAANLTSIGGDSLRRIVGSFKMVNLTAINSVKMPLLTTVGDIAFQALPDVQDFQFTAGLASTNVDISNTFLSNLSFNLTSANLIDIYNNSLLNTIDLPLETVTTAIDINNNGKSANVSFPNLRQAGSVAMLNVSAISMPALSFSDGIDLLGNHMTQISFDSLSVVTQSLRMDTSPNLTSISFPSLSSIGSLIITKNPGIRSIIFQNLSQADSVYIDGNLTRYILLSWY